MFSRYFCEFCSFVIRVTKNFSFKFQLVRDSSKNDIVESVKKEKLEAKIETTTTVTFVEGAGGLEKSKSDSKLNQVSPSQIVLFVSLLKFACDCRMSRLSY
jgi:glutaredoxin